MTVLHVNRLRFTDAIDCARRAMDAADASRSPDARMLALDATKAAYAYLGEVEQLEDATAQLQPLLRQRGNLWLLQWAVFESSFVPLVRGDLDGARRLMEEALDINRRSGFLAYRSWFLAHLAWLARLSGDLEQALSLGETSVRSADELSHPWWQPTALAMHGVTLLEADAASTATVLLERALAQADRAGTEAYRLRCLSALAQSTGSTEVLREADALFEQIACPDGSAWLLGADAYLCLARAWLMLGDAQRAAKVLRPFLIAARRCGWALLLEQAAPVVRRLPATALQP
jgi:tetratricopeptide (TPR) repeat protein